MVLYFDEHFKIKMSDRNFTQRFDVVMTSLSSDKKITVQIQYILYNVENDFIQRMTMILQLN